MVGWRRCGDSNRLSSRVIAARAAKSGPHSPDRANCLSLQPNLVEVKAPHTGFSRRALVPTAGPESSGEGEGRAESAASPEEDAEASAGQTEQDEAGGLGDRDEGIRD